MEISRIERVYRFLGLSQKQFAEALGFSAKMIKNYIQGAEPSSRFYNAVESVFPQININFIKGKEDNIELNLSPKEKSIMGLVEDGFGEYVLLDQRVKDLEARLQDKDVIIASLQDQIKLLKEKLGDCEGLSKPA